jgi:hypothetical protein
MWRVRRGNPRCPRHAHRTTGGASGGAHAALALALQVAAVAALVGLVCGGDVEGEPPEQRIGDIVRQHGQGAESFAWHS